MAWRGRQTHAQSRELAKDWQIYSIDRYDDAKTELDITQSYGRDAPLLLEIGFGNGENVWQTALKLNDWNILGVDNYAPGVAQLLSAIRHRDLSNVRVYFGVVQTLLERLPQQSLNATLVYFPDPWPKRRHHKRRLLQLDFIQSLYRCMAYDAILHVLTDDDDYATMIDTMMRQHLGFKALPLVESFPWRHSSHFERRGLQLGHKVHEFIYQSKVI